VLEDSRCPANDNCIWARHVRIRATIHLGDGDEPRELVLGEPVWVADGAPALVEVRPALLVGSPAARAEHRSVLSSTAGSRAPRSEGA
jgi:hypothetical protein